MAQLTLINRLQFILHEIHPLFKQAIQSKQDLFCISPSRRHFPSTPISSAAFNRRVTQGQGTSRREVEESRRRQPGAPTAGGKLDPGQATVRGSRRPSSSSPPSAGAALACRRHGLVSAPVVVLIREMEMPMNSVTQPGAHFPVQHRAFSLDIKGNMTDIVINKYEDTFLVIVTQIGCMGTILVAKKDESVFSDPTYNVSVVFGKRDEPLLLACARQLIEHISGSGSARSLLISLGLKDHSQGTLKDIIAAIIENRLW